MWSRSLALWPLLVACASTARVTGDFAEYQRYRAVRLASTVEVRLWESERYLHDYPDGDYRAEVRRWFSVAEKRYFKLAWNNLPRLRAYLSALPHGPHAEAVHERIGELEARRLSGERRDQRALDRAQTFEARLAEAAEQRRAFVREFSALMRLLAATRTFNQPSSELDSELLLRLRVRQPPSACQGDQCRKVFSFSYAVPEEKELTPRVVDVTLAITLDRGLLQSLTLSAPALLARVAEAVTVRAVPLANAQARAEAIGQALDIAAAALDPSLPKERCQAEAVSPVVLSRRCDGIRLEIVAGTAAGEPDSVVVSPLGR